ncbi:transmembrane protein, putative [Actinidia rufa]|uniref:Transmembrane protein, putative n=1 Tax=Actinidia rufa TaxID=165716 RepID=A0A7J0HG69_9ERIC|nr:transmembrane protein, putative [Actinidia rufa]
MGIRKLLQNLHLLSPSSHRRHPLLPSQCRGKFEDHEGLELKGCDFLVNGRTTNLGFRVVDYLPYKSYVRKSGGYLFVIQLGAKRIFYADDRGRVIGGELGRHFDLEGMAAKQQRVLQYSHVVNYTMAVEVSNRTSVSAMEVDEGEEERELNNNVMSQLTDPVGTPLGPPMYLPQNAGPKELQQMVNKLLNNSTGGWLIVEGVIQWWRWVGFTSRGGSAVVV